MTNLHDLSFGAFAHAIQPSGGMNRWPSLGESKEVVAYNVTMVGEAAGQLPDSARDHEYHDVAIHALTEKVGLNPNSFHDNVKVAELLALRHAYLSTVLEAAIPNAIRPEIYAEYNVVSNGFTHPWLQENILAQQTFEKGLQPALEEAAKAIGLVNAERAATGVSQGPIVSQNKDFTIQSLGNGVVVAHENRRLDDVPAVGDDVTVAYYRGRGQIVSNMKELRIGEPYVERGSKDLAVKMVDAAGNAKHVIMFSSMMMLNEFATENELGRAFVIAAMDARATTPKPPRWQPIRAPIGEPYLDQRTGSLAVDYAENMMRFTAIFSGADELIKSPLGAQLSAASHAVAKAIHAQSQLQDQSHVARSLNAVGAQTAGMKVYEAASQSGYYAGKVIADTGVHIVQDRGRNEAVVHDKRRLDKVPAIGENFGVGYKNGRGEVSIKLASKDRQLMR